MRTSLASLIVVKQEPNDEFGSISAGATNSSSTVSSLDDLSDDNNNKNFLISATPHSSNLLHSLVQTRGGGGGGRRGDPPNHYAHSPSTGGQNTDLNYGVGDSNNNKSCEANRNGHHQQYLHPSVHQPQSQGLYSPSVVEGIKVEKCFYANDRNNNINNGHSSNGWYCQDQNNESLDPSVQVKTERHGTVPVGDNDAAVVFDGSGSGSNINGPANRKCTYLFC